jgi:hypothetical protein
MRMLCFYGALSMAALYAAAGCGEPFEAGGAGGAGATSTSTSSGMGGEGGAGGGEPSTGGGGAGGCAACRPGEYCTASETCVSCKDFGAVLAFGTATEIAASGTAPSFPRVRIESSPEGATPRLVYTARFGGATTDIGTALGRPFADPVPVQSTQIRTDGPESGPLLLPEGVASPIGELPSGSLLFDTSLMVVGESRRKLFAADLLDESQDRALLSGLNVGLESYSIAAAYASQPYRYWFMNRRSSNGVTVTALVTKLISETGLQVLSINVPGGCPAKGDDLAPWVTPDGGHLFFQSAYSELGNCQQASVLRSFYVKLDPGGLPAGTQPATMLLPTLPPQSSVMTPSLSEDMCTLYFASNKDGQQKLYAAPRR